MLIFIYYVCCFINCFVVQKYFSSDPGADSISQVRSQIDEVKSVMVANIGIYYNNYFIIIIHMLINMNIKTCKCRKSVRKRREDRIISGANGDIAIECIWIQKKFHQTQEGHVVEELQDHHHFNHCHFGTYFIISLFIIFFTHDYYHFIFINYQSKFKFVSVFFIILIVILFLLLIVIIRWLPILLQP